MNSSDMTIIRENNKQYVRFQHVSYCRMTQEDQIAAIDVETLERVATISLSIRWRGDISMIYEQLRIEILNNLCEELLVQRFSQNFRYNGQVDLIPVTFE